MHAHCMWFTHDMHEHSHFSHVPCMERAQNKKHACTLYVVYTCIKHAW